MRYEVVGAFWGTFERVEPARVHNLSRYGALIESDQPLAVESMQTVRLMLDDQPALADARVRHVNEIDTGSRRRYLVGVEFVNASTAFQEAVERLMLYRARFTEHQ